MVSDGFWPSSIIFATDLSNYRDRLDALLETLHDQFTEWAHGPHKYGATDSRIDKFREWMA